MKNTEDYLHLYLGCNVLINNAKLENVISTITWVNNLGECAGDMYDWKAKDCQLMLRHLTDMTATEFAKTAFYDVSDPLNQSLQSQYKNFIINRRNKVDIFYNANDIPFLLKSGFDIFGLIEDGSAIFIKPPHQ